MPTRPPASPSSIIYPPRWCRLTRRRWLSRSVDKPTPAPRLPIAPPAGPHQIRIGLIAGHYQNDPGAICPDGVREVDINLTVAERVAARLKRKGYSVDLLG